MVGVGHPRLERPLAAHVFVDNIDAPGACSDDDAHHLARVLRLRDGEAVHGGRRRGRWRDCVVANARLEPIGCGGAWSDPARRPVTIGFALTKGDKPEFTVQKLTELGVDRIVPIVAAARDRALGRREGGAQRRALRVPSPAPRPCSRAVRGCPRSTTSSRWVSSRPAGGCVGASRTGSR